MGDSDIWKRECNFFLWRVKFYLRMHILPGLEILFYCYLFLFHQSQHCQILLSNYPTNLDQIWFVVQVLGGGGANNINSWSLPKGSSRWIYLRKLMQPSCNLFLFTHNWQTKCMICMIHGWAEGIEKIDFESRGNEFSVNELIP